MRTLALMAAGAIAFPAIAQTETLEVITVTAERRERVLSDVAGNAAVLSGSALARINPDHVQEALNRLPGVNLHRGSGQEHLTAIRSPVLTGGAGAGSFLFLEDGVPLRAAGFANVNGLFEAMTPLAAGLEVVRGPGSALYGSNAVHGLVNVRLPAADAPDRVVLTAGSFGRLSGGLRASTPFGSGRMSAAASALSEDGWRDAAGVDQQRALLRWDGRVGGWSARASLAFMNLNQETAGFVFGPDAYRDPAVRRSNPNPEAFRDAQAARVQSRFERGGETLSVAVTPYARWTDMTFLQHFLPYQGLEENGHWSLGVQSTAYWRPGPAFSAIVGFDAEYSRGFLRETQSLPSFGPFPQGVHYDYDVEAQVLAAYGEAEWRATPRLTFELGGRLEATHYDYDNQTADGATGRFLRPSDQDDAFLTFTPNLSALFAFGDAASAYIRIARGARAPQTTDLYRLQTNQTGPGADIETIDSVEIGLRGVVAGARFDLAAFHMDKDNFFFRDADGFNVTDGETRHQGIEAEVAWPITDRFELSGAGTYARHTYRFDRPVSRNATEAIAFGDDVDTAPRWLWNARAAWRPSPRALIEAEWAYTGRYYADASNTVEYPGHDIVNLRGEIEPRDGVVFGIAVRNLFDVAYAERADFAFGDERYFPGEDRAFSAQLRLVR